MEMKTKTLFENGSIWLKADFHLHTRTEKEFDYSNEGSEYPPENTFPNDYITKLKENSINLGVITNHNKFSHDEFESLRKKAKKEDIYLLPGVELSVNDGANGIHTLIIFSDEWIAENRDYINPFITSMFPGKAPSEYQNENGRSDKNILQVVEELKKTNRDFFLVFAHVEQKNGLWEEMKGGKLSDFADKRYAEVRQYTLAFQKVRTHEKKDGVCRTKVKSWLNNWYPAEVEGSDCKSIDGIGDCGTQKDESGNDIIKETWIKMGDFSFEAVKYALKDYPNRVKTGKPEKYKHSYIKSIDFEGGILNGHSIPFSPELNTLIGIRGSGKSSILEAVRYVLDIPLGERATDINYKDRLIQHTLGSGGRATITAIDQYGSEFKIKRILNEFPEVYVNDELQPGVSIKDTIINKPIYFGQKDLSASGEGFEKDLIEKLVGESLYGHRIKIEEQKQAVSDAVIKLQKNSNIDELISEHKQKKDDASFRLKKFQEYGVEEKFKRQTDFNADERNLKQILIDVKHFIDGMNSLLEENEDTVRNHIAYKSTQNEDFFEDFFKIYSDVISAVDNILSVQKNSVEVLSKLEEAHTDFQSIRKKFTDEFAETRRKIEDELKTKGAELINLEEYPELKTKIDTAGKMLGALRKQKEQRTSLQKDLLQSLSRLNDLWYEEYQKIKELLDIINNKNSSLKIKAEYKGDKAGFLDFFRSAFRGSKIRENTLSALVDSYSDFGSLYKDFENVKQNAGSSPETFEGYFLENLETLLTYQVQNKFTIFYRDKELQHHSLGQRASALILFILNQQDNDLIIIDQPEDDLDNQTIYEDVIKLIKDLKVNIQFIFATHNANFPVLGDAEQILSCRYSDEMIDNRIGSIDSSLLQKEIVDIMEGGEDAFNRRKEIYEIWKPQN
jgi:chromosome segregation protein